VRSGNRPDRHRPFPRRAPGARLSFLWILHAPALARLLDLASAANTFVRAEYEMFGMQSDEKQV
jgi:hypothetical protein